MVRGNYGFVCTLVTELTQKPYRHNLKANCPYGNSRAPAKYV